MYHIIETHLEVNFYGAFLSTAQIVYFATDSPPPVSTQFCFCMNSFLQLYCRVLVTLSHHLYELEAFSKI